jgi:hypothetical protein
LALNESVSLPLIFIGVPTRSRPALGRADSGLIPPGSASQKEPHQPFRYAAQAHFDRENKGFLQFMSLWR